MRIFPLKLSLLLLFFLCVLGTELLRQNFPTVELFQEDKNSFSLSSDPKDFRNTEKMLQI